MRKKLIIIGGGIAGLSAGIYGLRSGYDVEILEMHSMPGGQCTAWDRSGYRFDYCLHWLVGTASGPFHEVWRETDVITDNVTIIDQEVHTTIYDQAGNSFIIYTNIDQWEKYLIEFASEDCKAIRRMCADMRKAALMEPFSDAPGVRSLFDYLRAVYRMPRAILLMMTYGKKSCREYFQGLNLKNQKLAFFLQHVFAVHDFSALAFLMMLGWFYTRNAGYLIGGSLPMIRRMADKFSALGGRLTLNSRVAKVNVADHAASGVTLTDGRVIDADYVISAADGYSTIFRMLEGNYLSPQIKDAYETWPLFTPLVQVSFGIGTEIPAHNPVQTYLAPGRKIGSTELRYGYTVMNYSFDPTMAPKGKTVIIIRFESPWELWQELSAEAYRAEKKQVELDCRVILEDTLPGITPHIEVADVATPRTGVRYTGVWKGSYEGFMPTSNNVSRSLDMTLPGLRNFFMCGQWLSPGGGLPPSALSGKWVVQLIAKQDRGRQ